MDACIAIGKLNDKTGNDMRVVTAPNKANLQPYEICCFLAGGITGCKDWQSEVISRLHRFDEISNGQLDRLVVFNPRRDKFPDDPDSAREQIEWEFRWLQRMDIFSMFFTGGDSDQPICLYELGRNLCRMMARFPDDYPERIVISCDPNYKRAFDVKVQTLLAFSENQNSWEPNFNEKGDIAAHATQIIRQYKIQRIQQKQ